MHEHIVCEHEIKYCKQCDVCYCEKCGKEWKIKTWTVTYPDITITNPYTIYTNANNKLHTHY